MSEKSQWTLNEIRAAYRDILSAYNALFPLYPQTRIGREDIEGDPDKGEDETYLAFRGKMKKKVPELKAIADQSGNARVWHRGDPLDGLDQGLKDRIEKALKFGF